jgi:hypothetical protein
MLFFNHLSEIDRSCRFLQEFSSALSLCFETSLARTLPETGMKATSGYVF